MWGVGPWEMPRGTEPQAPQELSAEIPRDRMVASQDPSRGGWWEWERVSWVPWGLLESETLWILLLSCPLHAPLSPAPPASLWAVLWRSHSGRLFLGHVLRLLRLGHDPQAVPEVQGETPWPCWPPPSHTAPTDGTILSELSED